MPNKTALCIGINDYPGTGNDLNGCINDVKDWSAELKKRGFKVTTLLNSKATKSNIINELETMMTNSQNGDYLVVQFSGHGSYVPDENRDEKNGRDECLCPYDIVKNGMDNFITDDELFEIYSTKDKGARLVILSDSCHSGTVSRAAPMVNRGKGRKSRFLAPANFLSKKELEKFGVTRRIEKASPPGRHSGLLMSGCQDWQSSYDDSFGGRFNGAFTYVALRVLKTLKANATFGDWHKGIRNYLPSQDYAQTPNLYGTPGMKKWKIFA